MPVVCPVARVWFKPRALCRIYLFKVFSQLQQHRGEKEKPWGFLEWSGGAGSCTGLKCWCSMKGPCFGQSWTFLPELSREEDVGLVSVHSLFPASSELEVGAGVILWLGPAGSSLV